MKGERSIVFVVAVVTMMSCQNTPEEVSLPVKRCAVMPVPRASAAACTLGDKGYVFGGRAQDGTYLNDLWCYEPQTDSWTKTDTLPGQRRVKPLLFTDGEALYAGFGFSGGRVYDEDSYLKDFWRYTPADGQWEQLSKGPNNNTISPVPYLVGQKIYLLYSTGTSHTEEIKVYDIPTNRWDIVKEDGGRADERFAAAGGQCGGRCFFGTGLNKYNLREWYEVDLPANSWTERSRIPGKGRELCAYCATERYIYLFGGRYFAGEHTGGEVFDEYLRYSADEDRWERCGTMPCGRGENMIAFRIGEKVYFGLGEDAEGRVIEDLYCLEE